MINVIYIDDEGDTEKMASKFDIMTEHGITVTAVLNVKDAISEIQRLGKSLDAILLDIIMPPENTYSLDETNGGTTTGLRLLKDIRELRPDIPIIIVSVRRMYMDEDLVNKYEVAEYLEKPVSAVSVVDAVKRVVNEKA
jgi:CheY-like chemotaxis protein